jgi:MoxR-like ATPase
MRVKIIDEYNRIPTRTQSALLTLMADNYAELYDQTYECPEAAWYLTANDDAGGGTYQVIEALRDRIDIVVKALHFNTRFLGDLLSRLEAGLRPEEVVPGQIIFSEEDGERLHQEIRRVVVPRPILRRLEFFASQFEYLDPAAAQMEYKTKDTVKLSGAEWSQVMSLDTGKDKQKDIGAQTRNGMSVRSLMTSLMFVKAMAYFRGAREVSLEDVRQIIPFVLHDKLAQDPDCPFFEIADNTPLRTDKIGWIRRMFDMACAEYDRLNLDNDDPVCSAPDLSPADGDHRLIDTRKAVPAKQVLFLGVPRLGQFRYREIRQFARRAIEILASQKTSIQTLATTVHGAGGVTDG